MKKMGTHIHIYNVPMQSLFHTHTHTCIDICVTHTHEHVHVYSHTHWCMHIHTHGLPTSVLKGKPVSIHMQALVKTACADPEGPGGGPPPLEYHKFYTSPP